MSLLLPLLPLLAQVGPFVTPGGSVSLDQPPAVERKRNPHRQATPAVAGAAATPGRLQECLNSTASNPVSTIDLAEVWLSEAKGTTQAEPQLCLGTAYSELGRWDEAEAAFLAGRDSAAASDFATRARLGAMAGNAALATSAADQALAALDIAHKDAMSFSDTKLGGEIALDRARALVALKRESEAAAALQEARTANPGNAYGWLLSATLSRHMGKLADAQAQIQTAAELLPVDPEIGLEAGVIAMLSGHEEAARKSWQSVIAAGPDSDAATTARGYLGQLGPAPTNPAPISAPAAAK